VLTLITLGSPKIEGTTKKSWWRFIEEGVEMGKKIEKIKNETLGTTDGRVDGRLRVV
jgi:hypothetical protein